jgi:hypothetical protein
VDRQTEPGYDPQDVPMDQKAGMPAEEIGNLGLDGIGRKFPRTTAQNFSQRILKCTWLGELNDVV